MEGMMSSSSPCAACKLLRRKCTAECIFAPHFPPEQPARFANVHRVFGASNVAKLLKQLRPEQREDAVASLVYEAEARLRDPVHGCLGYIYLLQHKLREVQHDLSNAKKELSTYIGPAAFGHFLPHPQPQPPPLAMTSYPQQQLQIGASSRPSTALGLMGTALTPLGQTLMSRQQQQQQQHLAEEMAAIAMAAGREHEILSSYSQAQQAFDRITGVPGQLFNPPFAILDQQQTQAKARSEERSNGIRH